MECDPLLLAYLAGLFDGEGYVGMSSAGADRKKLIFVISVAVTDEATVDLFCSTFGGWKMFKPVRGVGTQGIWEWRMSRAKAVAVHAQLLPYLRIKREPRYPRSWRK